MYIEHILRMYLIWFQSNHVLLILFPWSTYIGARQHSRICLFLLFQHQFIFNDIVTYILNYSCINTHTHTLRFQSSVVFEFMGKILIVRFIEFPLSLAWFKWWNNAIKKKMVKSYWNKTASSSLILYFFSLLN